MKMDNNWTATTIIITTKQKNWFIIPNWCISFESGRHLMNPKGTCSAVDSATVTVAIAIVTGSVIRHARANSLSAKRVNERVSE